MPSISLGSTAGYATSGLVFAVDTDNTGSYPTPSTNWFDTVGPTTGVLSGGPVYSSNFGGGIAFNGTAGGVTFPGTNLNLTSAFTISSFCYSTNFNQNGFLFEKTTNGTVNTQYSLFFEVNYIVFRTYNTNIANTESLFVYNNSNGIRNNAWNNVVASFDGTTKRLYVNGVLVGSAAIGGPLPSNNTGPAYIGAYGSLLSYFFKGSIRSTQVYNRALSVAEIQQNYAYFTQGIYFEGTGGSQVAASYDSGKLLNVAAYPTPAVTGSYNWTPYFPLTRTPQLVSWVTAGPNMTVTGSSPYTITNTVVVNNWTQGVYSNESGTNFYAEAKASQTNTYIMFGLSRTFSASYTTIEYAIFFVNDGTIQLYENGTPIGTFGTYDTNTIGRVTYDGSYIRYYAGTDGLKPLRVVAVSGLTGLRFSSAFYNGGSLNSVYFGAVRHTVARTAVALVTGAGGGAAGYAESGGAGGHVEKIIDVADVFSVTVTVGAGGATVTYYAVGGTGTTSSFGSYCSATGGLGANSTAAHTGGLGGLGASGDVNIQGGAGFGHSNLLGSGANGSAGQSYWGSGQGISHSQNIPVGYGMPGAGGPGGRTDAISAGGAGRPGMVVVYAYS
jgi:hypothetical protein